MVTQLCQCIKIHKQLIIKQQLVFTSVHGVVNVNTPSRGFSVAQPV
jgi:hypothetical protein